MPGRQARDLVVTVNQRLRSLLGAESVDRLLNEIRRLNEILGQSTGARTANATPLPIIPAP